MDIVSVKDIKTAGRRVLVRVDFNVPLNEQTGEVTDDSRIRATMPTIQYLINEGAKVILCSHLGRPKGVDEKLRLGRVAERLAEILGRRVAITGDCVGPEAEKAAENLKNGEVLLLENLRFHTEEEKNEDSFSRSLARLAEIYVDDAFGTVHRAHASTAGVTKYLPAVAGLLLEKELKTLGNILENPERPFAGLFGGAKVSDKVEVLKNVLGKIDYLLIGGGMAGTFLKARGCEVGLSLMEKDMLATAAALMDSAAKSGAQLVLPIDVVIADSAGSDAKNILTVPVDKIPREMRIVDIGPQTVKTFREKLQICKTVFWNGPMGIYELPRFAEGTKSIANILADLKAKTVIGGGSTADIVNDLGLSGKMTFVSTGGGASLSFLGGEALPGVKALLNKKSLSDNVKGIMKK